MATNAYLAGRKTYRRPQAILLSDSPPTTYTDGNGVTYYIPQGYEVNSNQAGGNFLILSDHNRSALDFKPNRIEKRERMVNGRMRSYHIADKQTLSTSWNNLPSRAFSLTPNFDNTTGLPLGTGTQYTVDGGAGGVDLLNWYENHTGSFWVFLAYDKHDNFPANGEYGHLGQYNEVIEMFISNFDHTVIKRGGNTYDLWNVSLSLEEV